MGMIPALLMTLVEAAVLSGVFAYLYRARREAFLGWWTAALAASVVRHAMSVVGALSGLSGFTMFEQAAALAQASLVLGGALALSGRTLPRRYVALALVGLIWIVTAHGLNLPFFALTLPTFAFLGATSIAAGVLVWRAERARGARWFAGGVLVVWGLHQLDYPFLRPDPAVAPWGYALAAVLEPLTAVGFLVLANERALRTERESARRHRALLDNLPVGVFEASLSGRVLDANPALVRMLGFGSVQSLLDADPERLLGLLGEGARDPARLWAGAEIATAGPTELRIERADGAPIRVVLHGTLVEGEDGAPSHFEGIVRDVTERRRLQQILDRQRRMEALGRLAGGVAHDFNNLLTVIRAGTSILLATPNADPAQARWISDIDAASGRAVQLTRKLLALARGRAAPMVEVDVSAVTREARAVLERLSGEAVRIELDLEDAPGMVRMEEGALDQILLNLTTNARDAMRKGGRLHVSCGGVVLGRAEASALALEPGPHVRLRFCDEGAGMDAETQRHIFEPFFTSRSEEGGTGLGLATVFAHVDNAGGRIEVDSEPGRGSEFSVYWPVSDAEARPAAVARTQAARGGHRVLVIDDEDAVRDAVVSMLERGGFSVLSASGPEEAMRVASDDPELDVVLCDVHLGESSGPALVRALRPKLAGASFLFMSGYATDALDEDTLGRLIPKPFTMQELFARMEALGVRAPAVESRVS